MPTLDLSPLSGPLMLAFMISYMLYGVSMVQIFFYHVHYPKDKLQLKILVWFVFILETATTIVIGILGWSMFGKGFGNPLSLLDVDPTMAALPFINGIVASIVQNFLSWRIYKLTSIIWLPGIISIISLVGCAFSFFYGARILQLGLHFESTFVVAKYVDVWITCSAVSDVLATTAMVTILLKSSSNTIFKTRNAIISNLVKFTVETGLITATWAVIQLVLWLKIPRQNFHYIFYFGIARLYSNWLLATLNSRLYIASSGQVITVGTQPPAQATFWTDLPRARLVDNVWPDIHVGPGVRVMTTKEVKDDFQMNVISIGPSERTDSSNNSISSTVVSGVDWKGGYQSSIKPSMVA
ncbi:DUF6534 domain-containing protein [Pleurotus pulmonarius]